MAWNREGVEAGGTLADGRPGPGWEINGEGQRGMYFGGRTSELADGSDAGVKVRRKGVSGLRPGVRVHPALSCPQHL